MKQPILPQIEAIRPAIEDIVALNRELGIGAVYQNHAGARYLGATMWDLLSLIKDHPVEWMASAFDIRHATAESGLAWPALYNVMQPHVGLISVKDFAWKGHKAINVPLGEGRVDPKFFKIVRASGFNRPITLHVEYLGKAGPKENVAALRRDLETLRRWIKS